MDETQTVPWKRIAVEATAVVVSILLAFAIDTWWDDRQRMIEGKVILASLYQEAQELARLVDENRIYISAIRESTLRMLNASVASESEITDDEIDPLFNEVLWYIEPSFTNAPVLESLVNSGDINIISSSELRRQLGSFMVNLTGFRGEILRESDYFNSTFVPFIQKHVSMAQLYSLESRWPGFPERVYPPYNLAALKSTVSHRDVLESREFQNILLHRLTTTTNILEWQTSVIEPLLKKVVGLIESELENQPNDLAVTH